MDLPTVGPYELSEAPAVVAMVREAMVGSGRATARHAVSVAIVPCGVGRRGLVDGGEWVRFFGVGLVVPRLPVRCRATKKDLPGHLVPRQKGVRPPAARAASEAYVVCRVYLAAQAKCSQAQPKPLNQLARGQLALAEARLRSARYIYESLSEMELITKSEWPKFSHSACLSPDQWLSRAMACSWPPP